MNNFHYYINGKPRIEKTESHATVVSASSKVKKYGYGRERLLGSHEIMLDSGLSFSLT